MSERRSRNTKTINYACLDNGLLSDDEDFVEFTPSVKKKKISVKEKKVAKDVQDERKSPSKTQAKKKSPKQRPSLDERKFQREMEMALKLSAEDGNDSPSRVDIEDKFSGFETIRASKNDDKFVSEPYVNAVIRPIAGSRDILKNLSPCTNEEKSVSEDPVDRQTKRVNFANDDDSEDWSGNHSSESNPESDTDEDFCPSPQTKLLKKGAEKKLSSMSKKPNVKVKLIQSEKLSPKKEIITIASTAKPKTPCLLPLKSESNQICVDASDSYVSTKATPCTKTIPSSVSKSPKITKSPIPSSSAIGIPESRNSKHSFSLVKTPFKSPSIGSNLSNEVQKNNMAKTGLRLGLSRSSNVKSLHPNVCIR